MYIISSSLKYWWMPKCSPFSPTYYAAGNRPYPWPINLKARCWVGRLPKRVLHWIPFDSRKP